MTPTTTNTPSTATARAQRASPLLEVLFTPGWAALYDPASRERWNVQALLDPLVVECLGGAPSVAPEVNARLHEAGLVQPQPWGEAVAQAWCTAGWEDALRHYLHTNLLPKLSYLGSEGWREDFATMRQKVEESPIPPLTKHDDNPRRRVKVYGGCERAPLSDALEGSMETGPTRSLSLPMLGDLLVHAFGVSGRKTLAVTGEHVRRTSPSGGSRHPTEAYVAAFEVEGLAPGIYHFDSADSSLALLQEGQWRASYMAEVAGMNRRVRFVPRAALVLTSMVERSMHRYRDPRSYRVLHFDVGHLLMTLQLLARARGLSYFSAYSLADTAAERMLGIDGLMETAMCQFILG